MIEAHRDCLSAAGLRGIRRCRNLHARDGNEVPHDLPLLAAQDCVRDTIAMVEIYQFILMDTSQNMA